MRKQATAIEELERLIERMSRQFDDPSHRWGSQGPMMGWTLETETMAVDLVDREDEFVVTTDPPGFGQEDVKRRVSVPETVVQSKEGNDKSEGYSPEHVLVPFDRSFCSRYALEYAINRFPNRTVTPLFMKYPLFGTYESIESQDDHDDVLTEDEAVEPETRNAFEMAQQITDRYEQDVETATAEGDPSREIFHWLDQNDVDHVVTGSHGRGGIARWVLGAVAKTVARRVSIRFTMIK